MENLLEVPIVIIIAIIGYIFSLFKKKTEDQHENIHPKRTTIPAQTFDQVPGRTPVQETRIMKDKLTTSKEPAKRLEAEYLEREKQAEALAERLQIVSSVPREDSEPSILLETSSKLSPSKKQLVDGVIWSEILGPPRALNPHKSVKTMK